MSSYFKFRIQPFQHPVWQSNFAQNAWSEIPLGRCPGCCCFKFRIQPFQHLVFNYLAGNSDSGRDEYFAEAGRFIIEKDKASIGMLQRVYKIGFNRAARIMDQLSEAGIVGPEEGTKPRKILMTQEEFEQFLQNN